VGAVAATVDEVAVGLERVRHELPVTDGIKWFAWLYSDVTTAIAEIYDGGGFEDPEFIGRMVVDFGNAFFAAVETGTPSSHAWQAVWDRRHDDRVAPVQFAIAGLNAHVGYELPNGLAGQWRDAGLTPARSTPAHRDYELIDATIAKVEPVAKHYLLTGAVKELDKVFAGADDIVATWSVMAAREAAWAHAGAIWRLWDERELLDPYLAALDRSVGLVSRLLLVPTAV
jgi:hypothetical protein